MRESTHHCHWSQVERVPVVFGQKNGPNDAPKLQGRLVPRTDVPLRCLGSGNTRGRVPGPGKTSGENRPDPGRIHPSFRHLSGRTGALKTRFTAIWLFLVTIYLVLSFLSPLGHCASPPGEPVTRILHLDSYHQGYLWSDNILKGIRSVFDGARYEIRCEHMDTKRINEEEYLNLLVDLYKLKLGREKFDVIICSDDNAFHFMLRHHQELFPGVPVVFCGVNFFKDSFLRDRPEFTGVIESFDILSTIRIALQLHPKARRVLAIADDSRTGKLNLEHYENARPEFTPAIEFSVTKDWTIEELKQQLKAMGPDTIVLPLSLFRDKNGQYVAMMEGVEEIAPVSGAPLYAAWDFLLGRGIVGGMITSGYNQGRTAAQLAKRILDGESPGDIPVIKDSPNQYMFDYTVMQRFGIDRERLPSGSILINQPATWYAVEKELFWLGGALTSVLLLAVIILAVHIRYRSRSEVILRESGQRLDLAMNGANLGLWDWNPQSDEAILNDRALHMFGYEEGELELKLQTWQELVHPDDWPSVSAAFFDHLEGRTPIYEAEYRVRNKDGDWQWTLARGKVCDRSPDGSPLRITGTFLDIDARKSAEESVKKERDRAQQYLDMAGTIFVALDRDRRVILANRRLCETLGYDQEEVLGKDWFDWFLPEEDRGEMKEVFRTLLEGATTQFEYYENRVFTKDGEERLVAWHNTLVADESGHAAGTLSAGLDITERKRAESALRESEGRFRTAFRTSPDAITISRLDDGVYVDVNEGFTQLTGYKREEIIGKSSREINIWFNPDDRIRLTGGVKGNRTVRNMEMKFSMKDGSARTGLVSANVFHIGGEPHLLSVARDISDLKRAQEALKASETRYRALFDQSTDAILIVHPQGEIVAANPSAATLFGAELNDIIARSILEFYADPTDRTRFRKLIEDEGCVKEFDWRVRRRDGSVRYCILDATAWRDEHGQVLAYMGISRDLTERRLAEEERLRLVTAIEQSEETIFITDADGTIRYVNPAFERTTGYNREEAIGGNPSILKSGKHGAHFYQDLWRTIQSGQTWHGHFINRRKDGSLYEEDATISPVRDDSGTIVNYVAVKRDVTNEVMLQRQLLEAQKMEAVGTLAGGIAHDFNNLLHVIQGYADMALFDVKKDSQGYLELKQIRQAAKTAAELTRSLLTFSRRVEGQHRPVNLNHELKTIINMLKRTIPRMISIELELAENLHSVNADPAQLQQIIMNLGVNARDAMPDGGRFTIQTRNVTLDEEYCKSHLEMEPGDYVELMVSDTGTGMQKETAQYVFDPFYTTKDPGKGTGLGLSIVYGIVKSHGGNITCYSEPGEGTTFRIHLPSIEPRESRPEKTETKDPAGGKETILLVDDEDAVRKLGEAILKKFGYTVIGATNGREALELYERERDRISLVVLDLIMPEMGGKECLRRIREMDPGAKVVIASGYAADGQLEEALQLGAAASIKKPYQARQMMELVRSVLDHQ